VLFVVMRVGALDGPQNVSQDPREVDCEREPRPPAPEREEGGDPED